MLRIRRVDKNLFSSAIVFSHDGSAGSFRSRVLAAAKKDRKNLLYLSIKMPIGQKDRQDY